MRVAPPRVDDGAHAQVAYEALRGGAIAGGAAGGRGLVILLREGLAAWLAQRDLGADLVDRAPLPHRRADGALAAEDVPRGVIRVLASMVLGRQDAATPKETTA